MIFYKLIYLSKIINNLILFFDFFYNEHANSLNDLKVRDLLPIKWYQGLQL